MANNETQALWLDSSAGEVGQFHPVFAELAEKALRRCRAEDDVEWTHHVRSQQSDLIPDFVLMARDTARWVAAVEVKRSQTAVLSERFQVQAKAYAEANQARYRPGWPRYFIVTNLELTLVFALNGNRPPLECRVSEGAFASGEFGTLDESEHREKIIDVFVTVVQKVLTERDVNFDLSWATILSDFIERAAGIPSPQDLLLDEPETPSWHVVRDYFGSAAEEDAQRLFLLRCLLAEYVRAHLLKFGHPRGTTVPPLQPAHDQVARTIDGLRAIDFEAVLEEHAARFYRGLVSHEHRAILSNYVALLIQPPDRLLDLVTTRVDTEGLVDGLLPALYPLESADDRGKVQTDPELAAVLATLAIDSRGSALDPCCGDGPLLLASFKRLERLGATATEAFGYVRGLEADPVATRLAATRLALRQPEILETNVQPQIRQGDMFANAAEIASANFILMNPPFRRYEAQDPRPVPSELLVHYTDAIGRLDGNPPVTLAGQPNLFHYYVEFVGKAAGVGATIAVILDNRWYHNRVGQPLRAFLLRHFEILGIFEYPMARLFRNWTIATSIVLLRKVSKIDDEHEVRFARSRVDVDTVDLNQLAAAVHDGAAWPHDWSIRTVPQAELSAAIGWKRYFGLPARWPLSRFDLTPLAELFEWGRRGSLEKEGYGTQVYEFPFDRSNFGPKRRPRIPRRGFATESGDAVTTSDNKRLRRLARSIPAEFRGWAIKNADDVAGFTLTADDVERRQTLEPPTLRQQPQLFTAGCRSDWTSTHEEALDEMRAEPAVGAFINAVEMTTGFDRTVLPDDHRFVVLREPYAGELIIPRKTRVAHRVHLNPFIGAAHERRVRISSNFITYGNCLAAKGDGLDGHEAVTFIAAFLLSAFGQLQFEVEGYNREGLLSVEKEHLDRVMVIDPRTVDADKRAAIIAEFESLTAPIRNDVLPQNQPRSRLDRLVAEAIAARAPAVDADELLTETYDLLAEWLEARQP